MNFPFQSAAVSPPILSIPPGGFLVSKTPSVLRTLLGSCVSACLFDPKQKIAGMNHYLLPDCPLNIHPSIEWRYACRALPLLLEKMEQQGAQRQDLRASIFGGGDVVSTLGRSQVGHKNVLAAQHFFQEQGIRIINQHTSGKHPRRLYFDTQSGQIKLECLPHAENTTRSHNACLPHQILYFQA